VVSFDFDDTLTLPAYNPEAGMWEHGLEPNYVVLNELMRLATLGYTPIVISERSKSYYNKSRIRKFSLLYDLPIKAVIYTDGAEKATFLASAKSQMHYDDDPHEILCLAEFNIMGIAVPHPNDYMTQEDYRMAMDSWRITEMVFGGD
jgi:hypothetical protein